MFISNKVTNKSIDNARKDASLKLPSKWKSAGMALAETATSLPRFGADILSAMNGMPATNPLDKSFEVFNKSLETPNMNWTQKTVDFFGSGIGYLNPMSDIALIKPAAAAVEATSAALMRALPSGANAIARTPMRKFGGLIGELTPDTIEGAGKHLAKAMAIGTSLTLPESFLDNYNEKTGKFDIAGSVSQAFSNGVLSVAIDLVPVTAGAIFGKHKKTFAKEYENPLPGESNNMSTFDTALKNNEISKEEHDWIKTYLENPNNTQELKKKGVSILLKEGYNVDTAKQEMLMNLFKKDHYDNFHTAMLDQISSGANDQYASSLSDYVAATGLDFMTAENSKFIDGLNGYVHWMENRLEHEPKNMKRMAEARKKADLYHIENDHPISQSSLLKELKAVDYDIQKIPHAVPKNLQFRAFQENRLSRLRQSIGRLKKLSKKDKAYESKLDESAEEFRDIKSKIQKALSPQKELKELESHFLDRKELPDNYQQSHDYHRLIDLSHFSTKADALLHHIDIKQKYEVQTAYKDMIKFLSEIMESNVNKFANTENVINYFKNKYSKMGLPVDSAAEKKIGDVNIKTADGEFSSLKKKDELIDIQQDLKSDVRNDDEILKANETDVDSANSKNLESDFKNKKERYEQFKTNELTLSQLVSCELGSTDGEK